MEEMSQKNTSTHINHFATIHFFLKRYTCLNKTKVLLCIFSFVQTKLSLAESSLSHTFLRHNLSTMLTLCMTVLCFQHLEFKENIATAQVNQIFVFIYSSSTNRPVRTNITTYLLHINHTVNRFRLLIILAVTFSCTVIFSVLYTNKLQNIVSTHRYTILPFI